MTWKNKLVPFLLILFHPSIMVFTQGNCLLFFFRKISNGKCWSHVNRSVVIFKALQSEHWNCGISWFRKPEATVIIKDSHSYLIYSSSHPQHVKTQPHFLNFFGSNASVVTAPISAKKPSKCAMLLTKAGYPESVVNTGEHRVQEINRETEPRTSQNKKKKDESHSPSPSTRRTSMNPIHCHLPPTSWRGKKMTKILPNQVRVISTSRATLPTTRQSAAFPYTKLNAEIRKNLEQKCYFNPVLLTLTGSVNASRSINLFWCWITTFPPMAQLLYPYTNTKPTIPLFAATMD